MLAQRERAACEGEVQRQVRRARTVRGRETPCMQPGAHGDAQYMRGSRWDRRGLEAGDDFKSLAVTQPEKKTARGLVR